MTKNQAHTRQSVQDHLPILTVVAFKGGLYGSAILHSVELEWELYTQFHRTEILLPHSV